MVNRRFGVLFALLASVALPTLVFAHGSVTPDSDSCIIQIGFYKAHFKIYQPETRAHSDYCEDLPDAGPSLFVMEYAHSGLGEVAIDFRIIENVTGKAQFATLEDIEDIADIDAITVYHHPAAVQRDVFIVSHEFEDTGEFIGLVTLVNPLTGNVYNAVFPFEVGYWSFGYWPLILLAALVLQVNYLWMSGWFRNRKKAT